MKLRKMLTPALWCGMFLGIAQYDIQTHRPVWAAINFLFACLWALDFFRPRPKPAPILDDSCSECGGTDKSWIDGKRCRACAAAISDTTHFPPSNEGEKQEARADLSEIKRESFRAFWARWEETHGGRDTWMDCPCCDGSGWSCIYCGECPACQVPGLVSGGSGRVKIPIAQGESA